MTDSEREREESHGSSRAEDVKAVTVRLTDDGPARYRTGGVTVEPGDEVVVTSEKAARLCERAGFERREATCQAVQADGEICGRELPCRYHAED